MKLKISKSFIWIGIGLGGFWWIIESIIRVVIFKMGNFMEELLTDDPNELWMRSVVTALFFSFGLLLQFTVNKLEKAHNEIKTLRGLLPICANCKKIRDDKGYWNTIVSQPSAINIDFINIRWLFRLYSHNQIICPKIIDPDKKWKVYISYQYTKITFSSKSCDIYEKAKLRLS